MDEKFENGSKECTIHRRRHFRVAYLIYEKTPPESLSIVAFLGLRCQRSLMGTSSFLGVGHNQSGPVSGIPLCRLSSLFLLFRWLMPASKAVAAVQAVFDFQTAHSPDDTIFAVSQTPFDIALCVLRFHLNRGGHFV